MQEITAADHRARVIVCGLCEHTSKTGAPVMRLNSTGFSREWMQHPWVREAMAEGWDRDLRASAIRRVFRSIMAKQDPHDVSRHLPSKELRDHWRSRAARYAAARDWQIGIVEKYGSLDGYVNGGRIDKPTDWKRGHAPAFADMQRASANRNLHMTLEGLSATSRRITGEHGND